MLHRCRSIFSLCQIKKTDQVVYDQIVNHFFMYDNTLNKQNLLSIQKLLQSFSSYMIVHTSKETDSANTQILIIICMIMHISKELNTSKEFLFSPIPYS